MEKIKLFLQSEQGKDIMVVLIIILVGLGSFELGRMSKESPQSGIRVQAPTTGKAQAASTGLVANSNKKVLAATNPEGKTFFASNRGTKYYPVDCSAGQTIKQENRIYFTTKEEAERAGYELSSSCQ